MMQIDKLVKRCVWVLACMVLCLSGFVTHADATPGVRLLSADSQGALIEFTAADPEFRVVELDGQVYDQVSMPGLAQTDEPGKPQVPVSGVLLGASGAGAQIQVLKAEYETWSGYRLYPAPALEVEEGELGVRTRPVFSPDAAVYSANAFYPGPVAQVGFSGRLRDQDVVQVQFYPLQYNPAAGEVRFYRRILAQVTWDAPAKTDAVEQAVSPAYESLLRGTLLNYETLARPEARWSEQQIDPAAVRRQPLESLSRLRIGVTADGMYRLTYDDLTGAGFIDSPDTLNSGTIQISNRGLEVPILVMDHGDGHLGPGDTILFYGLAITDMYTCENVYWLTAGLGPGQHMDMRDVTPGSGVVPDHFPTTMHGEENSGYWGAMPDGEGQDHWFWGPALTAPETRVFTMALGTVSTAPGTAAVHVGMHGRTGTSTWPDHHTRIYVNGANVEPAGQTWDGQVVYEHEVTFDHALLSGDNLTVTVEAVGDTGSPADQVYVNWIELDYWRTYVAQEDELQFGAPEAGAWRFQVQGLTGSDLWAFDVTTPGAPVLLTGGTVVDQGDIHMLQFEDGAALETRYLALNASRFKSPARLELDQPSNWKSEANGADYLIITHADFYTEALRLADHRDDTLRVATIKIQDIYDEFNDGIFHPQAIRDLIAYAYDNWEEPAPSYVLLLGDAYQDYKDYQNTGTINYVPSQIVETDLLGQAPSDNWFVEVSGPDVLPDLYIGRLTAQTAAEAHEMVDKIISYEQNPPDSSWNKNVLLVADDDDPSFESAAQDLAASLPYHYTPQQVYVRDYTRDVDDPTTDITNTINSGSVLVSYFGHGNFDMWGVWGEEPDKPSLHILDRSPDVVALNNMGRLPVVTVGNCLNGFFVKRQTEVSMAEEFLRLPERGAVAVWAPTGLGYPSGHQALMLAFYDALFELDLYGLGQATTAAKVALYGENGSWGELVRTFVLFGDPALRVGIPENYPYPQSVSPANGATGVPIDQKIRLVFNREMAPATVALSGPAGMTFTPAWSAGNRIVEYTHPAFGYGQQITLLIGGQDTQGNSLGSGPAPTMWSFTTQTALTGVTIGGPPTCTVNVGCTFQAVASPSTAVLPINYTWQATNQPPVTHTGGGVLDGVTWTWSITGTQSITVTATNALGTVTDSHVVLVGAVADVEYRAFLPLAIK